MAQTRRHPNVLTSYITSRNGTSERVEEREKAKIARMQNVDPDGNKQNPSYGSYPLFPSPRRVKEDDDGIKVKIQNVLGDFTDFKRIMNQETNPGITCIGVVSVPATPTEGKTQYFGPENKPKPKSLSLSSNGVEKPKESRVKEKTDHKSKPNLDSSKHKVPKSSKKSSATDQQLKEQKPDRDIRESKGLQTNENSSSIDKIKTIQTSGLICGNSKKETNVDSGSGNTYTKVPEESLATNTQNNEAISTTTTSIKRSVESSETAFQESANTEIKMEPSAVTLLKPRPMPIQIRSRDGSSFSDIKSLHHSDMKVQNILKEMTEAVTVPPLTGICTPVPSKVGSRFPFPSSVVDNKEGYLGKEDSLHTDLVLSDSDVEQINGDVRDTSGRIENHSSSSSSSSSSDESDSSSDSENEESNPRFNVPKQTQLNAISPPVASTAACITTSTPKNNHCENLTGTEKSPTKRTSPHGITNSEKMLEKLPMGLTDCNSTSLLDQEPLLDSVEQITVQGASEEQSSLHESSQHDDKTLNSGAKLHPPSLNNTSTLSESTCPDKEKNKSRPEPLAAVKIETNETVKGNAEPIKNKPLKIGNSKLKNEVITKQKKQKKRKEEKEMVLVKKKVTKVKSEDAAVVKKSKISEVPLSKKKDSNITKTIKKEVKEVTSKKHLLQSDTNSDDAEDSVIDVVGDKSPVVKEKRRKLSASSKVKPNGLNGCVKNGHVHDMPLDIQVIRDDDKELKSLLVRIDLSLLKRIPKKALQNGTISVLSAPAVVEVSSVTNEEKKSTQSDRSAAEQVIEKKDLHNDNEEKSGEQISSEKCSSTSNGHTKRSPSWDKDHYPKKRVRRDTDSEKGKTSHKNRTRETMAEQNAEVEEDIKKVNPDAHLQQAKTLKREADKLTDKEAKSRTYVEAIIRFISCGRALEDKEETEQRAGQMYSETTELLRFVLKHVLGKSDDKRLLVLCLRIQSLLLHKLYRMKNRQVIRNSQTLAEYFKATQKNNITSPYPASNKHASTPSPMSPTPSPAGSIGSIGSSGSNSSGEGNPASSLNGRHLPHMVGANSSVMSPVSMSIPQRIYTVMSQHVSSTSKLVHSVDIWEKADNLMADYQDFFSTMDSICGGALTFHSSIAHVVNYVKRSLSKLHDCGKET